MFDEYIENKKDEIINTICELIKYKSISLEDSTIPDAPFGIECKKL